MKVYSIAVLRNDSPPALILASANELSSFGFFQKGSVAEFMTFFSKTVAERTRPGQRQSIEEQAYIGHVFARTEGLAGVLIADKEYPVRVAFSVLNKILDEFVIKVPREKYRGPAAGNEGTIQFPELGQYIIKYQDPRQADTIMRVQQELDETKIVLHKTIESVLQRGEKLDDLVQKSDQLSTQSKMFYKTAKKTNSCCTIM